MELPLCWGSQILLRRANSPRWPRLWLTAHAACRAGLWDSAPSDHGVINHRSRMRRILALLAACAALTLIAGCVVSGPTRDNPTRNGQQSTDPARDKHNLATAEANLDTLRQSIRSYAIVDAKRDPKTNIHLFALPGVDSLNSATEKTLLQAIRSAGGFHTHRAYSPVATAPAHRWASTAFVSGTATSAQASENGHDHNASTDVEVSNRIIAAGGDFLISLLTAQSPTEKTWAVLTDLRHDTTVHVQDMFTTTIDPAEVAADDSGNLTIGGTAPTSTDLTSLGTKVIDSLHFPLTLPEGGDERDPDFSCTLLPCVALTYDDGPGKPAVEDRLLKEADTAKVRLSYFLVGRRVAADPSTTKRISAAGHEIANHTFSHPRLNRTSNAKVKKEIKKTDRSLEAATSKAPELVRPPFGALDRSAASALGRPAIIWDVDTGDWKHKDADRTVSAVRADAGPGSIVLMHSIHPTTVDAAPGVFRTVRDKGLYPVTVSQLFAGIGFEKGGSYFCRGYADELCSNPEHPAVHKN